MKKNAKIITGLIAATALAGATYGGIEYKNSDHSEYAQIATDEPTKAFKAAVKSKAPVLAIYYSHDCQDCLNIQSLVHDEVKKQESKANNPVKIIVMDKFDTGSQFMLDNHVTQTPTFQVRQGDKIIYQYAGTSPKTVTSIIRGINPQTNESFDFNEGN